MVREKAQSKDTDKLIRRLSLVALLLSRRGRPGDVAEIRSKVEGYPTMTEEAFKRRFFEDRDELRRLGIEIQASEDPLSETSSELYSLPADAYYLEPVALDGDEVAALAACLAVLEDRFAYSQPLRLALLSLAQGRPELLAEAERRRSRSCPSLKSRRPPCRSCRRPSANARPSSSSTTPSPATRRSRASSTRTRLQLVAGEWYLVGWCHLREDLRTFRLSRVRSGVKSHARRPHDFAPPDDFDLDVYRDRPAWQLAAPRATARVRVSPALAWWVEAHWAHCGAVQRMGDGSIVYETPYADPRPSARLGARTRGRSGAAGAAGPARARRAGSSTRSPSCSTRRRRSVPRMPRSPHRPAATPPADRDWRVEVDRFTRLTTLTSYLIQSCDRDEAVLDAQLAAVRRHLGVTAEELRENVGLLNLVNFGGDGLLLYAEYEGRTS